MFKKITVYRRFIALTLIMSMIYMMIPMRASAAKVTDISNHWAQNTIQRWIDQELVQGYPDGSFRPDNNITRAEFITMINKAFDYSLRAPISYSDVKVGAWYYNSIEIAVTEGYIDGYPDGTMKPENLITREEVATLLMNMNKLTANISAANIFTDAENFSWSKGAIGAVFEANLMDGYPDGSFGNNKFIKRGEALVALDNNFEYIKDLTIPQAFPGIPITPIAPAVTRDDTTGGGSGSGSGSGSSNSSVKVSAITVNGARNVTNITTDNGTLQMSADIQPTTATIKSVTWSVINGTGKATISNTGFLTAIENGNVTVSATANDGSGAYGQVVVTISGQESESVVDTTSPVVTLTGNEIVNVPNGISYSDAGATATDNIDGNITSSIVTTITNNVDAGSTFDNKKAATYTYHYNVSDAAGNAATEVTRTVIVAAEGVSENQVAPEGLEGVAPTTFGGSDGMITGTTSEMEYRESSDQTWTPVTETRITGLEAGFYDVRYAAKPGFNEGIAATIGVAPGPNEDQAVPTGLEGIAPTAFGESDGKITGTTSKMEYRLLTDDNWTTATGTEILGLEAGFYDVRYAAKPGFNEGTAVTITIPAGPNQNQGMPEGLEGVAPTTFGGSDGKITGTTSKMEYRLLSDDTWTPATETEIMGLKAGWYDVRYAAIDGYDPGDAATVGIEEGPNEDQAAPEGLVGIAPTTFDGDDGKITGTTIEMEYRLTSVQTWTPATETEISGLEAGWYDVRYAAKPGYNEGIAATIGVAPGPNEDQAAPEGLVAVAPTTFGGDDGKITGTTIEMEYRPLLVQTWTTVTGTEITGLEAGYYEVRYAARPGFNEGTSASIQIKEALATLNAITIDGISLQGFSADILMYNIELPAGTTIVPTVMATATDSNAPVVITPAEVLPGETTILVIAQDGITQQTYSINFILDSNVPLGLVGVAPTTSGGSDGKITGTTNEMEYRKSSDTIWVGVTGTEITGLAAGTYLVRFKAEPGYSEGAPAYVVVPNFETGKLIFTFDDGWKDTIVLGKPILDTAGFKATVYVNRDVTQAAEYGWSQFHIDNVMDYADLHELYNDGWDVSNHSTNHLDYKRTTDGALLVGLDGEVLEWQTPETYGIAHPEIPEEQVYTEWLKTLVAIGSDTSQDTIERLREVYEDNQIWLADDGPDRLGKLVNGIWTPGQNLNMPLSAYHIAYPSGLFSDELVTMIQSIGAETGRATTESKNSNNIIDPDFFRLPVQYVETDLDVNGNDKNLADVKASIDFAVANGSTVILMLHRVGPAGDLFVEEESLQYIVDYAKSFTDAGTLDVMTISQWYNIMK